MSDYLFNHLLSKATLVKDYEICQRYDFLNKNVEKFSKIIYVC